MNCNDFEKTMKFVLEIDKLKNIFRRSKIIGSTRYENTAEHSWHISVMAYALYPFFMDAQITVDVPRAVKMLLIHDIVEIYAGDTYCYDTDAGKDKLERELNAADKIFGGLPQSIGEEFKSLWLEFDNEATDDSIFASIMDKIQPFLLNYGNDGEPWIVNGITKSQVLKRMDIVINKSPSVVRDYVIGIIEDSVKKGYLLDC